MTKMSKLRNKRLCNSKKGFTLVEVLVSLVIMVIVIVGVVSGVILSQDILVDNNEREKASAQAQELADEVMEIVKGLESDEVNALDFDALLGTSVKKLTSSESFTYNEAKPRQVKITYDKTKSIHGYTIEVAVFCNSSDCVKISAFAPDSVIES